MKIAIIVAYSHDTMVIGKDNQIPWNIPQDLKRFKELTTNNAVIFGKNTFYSIGKVLPNRLNIVVSTTTTATHYTQNTPQDKPIFVKSLHDAIKAAAFFNCNKVFLCGGQRIYEEGLKIADEIFATKVIKHYDGDTYFPQIDENIFIKDESNYDVSTCIDSSQYYEQETHIPVVFEHYVRQ